MNFYKAGSGVGPVTGYPVKPLPVKSIRMFWNEIMKYFTMILLFLCMLFLCSSCTISHVQIPNLKCDEAWKISKKIWVYSELMKNKDFIIASAKELYR